MSICFRLHLLLWPLFLTGPAAACGPVFYAAAPALTPGEMSYAVRSLANLHDLSTARAWTRAQADTLAGELLDAGIAALSSPKDEALPKLGALQQRNRDGAYRAGTANFLTDLTDLLHTEVPPEARAAYVTWRRGLVLTDSGIATEQARNAPRTLEPGLSEEVKAAALAGWKATDERKAADREAAEKLAAAAPEALRPFYRVQQAALEFRRHDFAAALAQFERVTRESPAHPRAETATFMALRCRIEIARDAVRRVASGARAPQELADARQASHDFAARYPQSRYAAELPGWEGALHYLSGEYDAAFVSYARQAETKGHPEIVRQALHEAERCLLKLGSADSDPRLLGSAVAALPACPRAAMRMVYFMLEPAGSVDYTQWPWTADYYQYEGGGQEPDRLARRWRIRAEGRRFLKNLAAEIMAQRQQNRVAEWDPFSLAVVAWQATEDGEHGSALSLCRRYPLLVDASDDLQTVRAIALQRAGENEEAIAAWRGLVRQFPHSPLAQQAHQRLVALLKDAGRPAEALVLIMQRGTAEEKQFEPLPLASSQALPAEAPPPGMNHDYLPLLEEDLSQWRDVLALMTPLPGLEDAWRGAVPGLVKDKLAELLAVRWLSAGEPEKARPFMEQPDPPTEPERGGMYEEAFRRCRLPFPLPATVPVWQQWVQPIADAHAAAAKLTGPEAAIAWLAAGKLWAAARREFRLWEPAAGYMNSEYRAVDLRVRRNAIALGWPAARVTEALLLQDFLAPATDCWQRAISAAPESEAAAEAIFLSNEALLQRAELTPFAMQVAGESTWSADSARWVAQLRSHPLAGKWKDQCIAWDFSGGMWLPGNQPPQVVDEWVAASLTDGKEQPEAGRAGGAFDPARTVLAAFDQGGRAAVATAIAQLRLDARAAITTEDCSPLNLVEDLAIALEKPELPDKDLREYWEAVSAPSLPLIPSPAVADLLDYLSLRRGDVPVPSQENRYLLIVGQWLDYQKKYPQSPRREAAMFQILRTLCRAARSTAHFENQWWSEGGPLTASRYPVIVTARAEAPPTAAEVARALQEFTTAYPKSRFLADAQLLRGSAALEAKDYGSALDLLIPLTSDAGHRELQLPAALHLADLFLRLLDPPQRPAIAAALKERPAARAKLRAFMASDTPGGRLAVFQRLVEP